MKSSDYSFLTWNLCLLENSHQAPASWRVDQTEAYVRNCVLELNPDFVFFQELPGMVPYVETHDLVPANTLSHSGNLATLAKHELMSRLESRAVGRFAVVTTLDSADLTFANVHLEPGGFGEHKRLESLSQLVAKCPTPGLVIAGDTNTRIREEDSVASLGLTGKRPPRPTWNSKLNRFRENGKRYTAYYTRYFHNANVELRRVKVWDQPLHESGKSFYVSDHFAMSGEVTVSPSGATDTS